MSTGRRRVYELNAPRPPPVCAPTPQAPTSAFASETAQPAPTSASASASAYNAAEFEDPAGRGFGIARTGSGITKIGAPRERPSLPHRPKSVPLKETQGGEERDRERPKELERRTTTGAGVNFPRSNITAHGKKSVNVATREDIRKALERGPDELGGERTRTNSHYSDAHSHSSDMASSTYPPTSDPAREPLLPSSLSRPDRAQRLKEETLRRKLKTYSMFLALRDGYLPSTDQLVGWARYSLRSGGVLDTRSRRLSPQGRAFLRELRNWIEAGIDIGLGKNADDKIQEFIWHTSHAQVTGRLPDVKGATGRATSGGSMDMKKAYSRLRQVGTLVYSSPEFRRLITELASIAQDMFVDAASHLATQASQAADSARQASPSGLTSSPSTIKEKGTQYAESARRSTYQRRDDLESYLRQKFPKQRRDALVNRLKSVVSDIQDDPDFSATADFVFELAREYVNRLQQQLTAEGRAAAESARIESSGGENHFDVALKDAKAILEAFANGRELDGIHDALRQVVDDIQNDQELAEFYSHATRELKRLLTEKDYVTSDAADDSAHKLYARSQELLHEKSDRYHPDVSRLFDEVGQFTSAMSRDTETLRLLAASRKVYQSLVSTDRRGNFSGFKRRVLLDLVDVVFPRLAAEMRYVPLPRIEYQDRDYDLILENVVLESEHFLPARTVFEAFQRAEFACDDYGGVATSYAASSRLRISHLNLLVRDAAFVVRKKTGLFAFRDRGFVDVFMDGRGASAEIVLDAATDDDDYGDSGGARESYFHVREVHVTIHRFTYAYRGATHSWAAALLRPFLRPAVRRILAGLLEQKIRALFEAADRELHAAAERMRVASIATRGAGAGSFEAWLRAVLSRPDSARRSRRGYRVCVGAEEELFPGEHAPGSIVRKFQRAGEGVEEADEDGGWRHGVFDVR